MNEAPPEYNLASMTVFSSTFGGREAPSSRSRDHRRLTATQRRDVLAVRTSCRATTHTTGAMGPHRVRRGERPATTLRNLRHP